MKTKLIGASLFALYFAVIPGLVAQGDKKEIDAVHTFLKKAHPNKKWQTGPTLLASDALKKAYGERARFYYVFSAPPLPPGANLPELIKAYQARLKDHNENYLSVTMRVEGDGKVVPLTTVGDLRMGLMNVKSEEDARIVAAAVLSLHGSGRVAPGVVIPAEVRVQKHKDGWQATVERRLQFQGMVQFNKNGEMTNISKDFTGPVPP